MRINGFEQIKAFYSFCFSNQHLGIKPQHISLYLFLVNQNNRNNWIEWFKVPYDLAMGGSCISSKKTYYSCLSDLQIWKLIQYEKGVNNWKAPLIKLEVLKDTSTVPQSEPQVLQSDLPQVLQAMIQAVEPLPIHNIKLLTNNIKQITNNIEKVLNFLNLDYQNKSDDLKEIDNNLISSILSFFEFDINNPNHIVHQRLVLSFLKVYSDHEYFFSQFNAYKKLKEKETKFRHSLNSFLGKQENLFEDGKWMSENWIEKLKQTNLVNNQHPAMTLSEKNRLERLAKNNNQ